MTVGTPGNRELARFYAPQLRGDVAAEEPTGADEPADAGWARLGSSRGAAEAPPERGVRGARRLAERPGPQAATDYLDIVVDALDPTARCAMTSGAALDTIQRPGGVRVLRDLDGYRFCLFR